jgi:hypothetical protein
MRVRLHYTPGLRNDLTVWIPREELEDARLCVTHRERLMSLPGLPRHREPTAEERRQNSECKIPVEAHLEQAGLLDDTSPPRRRVLAVGNRNLGNNHGGVAWQRHQEPRLFRLHEDPLNFPAYSCLVHYGGGNVSIEDLHFDPATGDVYQADEGLHLAAEIEWATFGQRVLRAGKAVPISSIIEQFYDIRHVLAFDTSWAEGREINAQLYEGYPDRFRQNALRALQELGVPRSRYLHNCIGLSPNSIVLLQREGTVEEVALGLREAGAQDGLILDNGGSVACWAWSVYPRGGFLFAAPDYRPNATSIIALVLGGPVRTRLPGGSVSYTVV